MWTQHYPLLEWLSFQFIFLLSEMSIFFNVEDNGILVECSLRMLNVVNGGAQCMYTANSDLGLSACIQPCSSGARAKHVTTTKPAVSYVLSRLSVQASYHHLSTQLGLKVILRQWTPRSAPPSRPQCWNTHSSNKSQVSGYRYTPLHENTFCHNASE